MILNPASTIIKNILIFDVETVLQTISSEKTFAISPIINCRNKSLEYKHFLRIKTAIKTIDIPVLFSNFNADEEILLSQYLHTAKEKMKIILEFVLKKSLQTEAHLFVPVKIETNFHREIITYLDSEECNRTIHLIIPNEFFRLFSKLINPESTSETIDNEIIYFFKNPVRFLPDLRTLLETITSLDLGKLLNHLQRMNLLTTYQLTLLIQAFPEYSIKIKNTLSRHTIEDIVNLRKSMPKNSLTKRDIVGGIYSIEESISFLLKSNIDFSYSNLLMVLQKTILTSIHSDILLRHNFKEWIQIMIEAGLLYKTITKSRDTVIASAISKDTEYYIPILSGYISEVKLHDLLELVNQDTDFEDIWNSQIEIIQVFRKLKLLKYKNSYDSLEYLLTCFIKKSDYLHLLLSVGWFTLSTSLKGMKKKNIYSVLNNIPYGPKFIIEDILKGTVNPNILHDEMQINRAKLICIKSIIQLYEDNIIELDI